MATTIEDVAKRAGVSRSTVSLVINKSPLVKDATREMVEQVILEMNYVPNNNARGLSARVTNNLGVIFMQDRIPTGTEVSYGNDQHVGLCSFNISNGIMAGLAGTDYGVVTERFCSIASPNELPRIIMEKRVDGVFIVGLPYSDSFIDNIKNTGLPFVVVGVGSYEEDVDSFYADPGTGMEIAVHELIETGHENICLMNCALDLPSHQWRLDGFRRGLAAYGKDIREGWNITPVATNGKEACEAFRKFWEAGNRPDAVVTANGQSACGVMHYLYKCGVHVPDDVSIIAYDDSSINGYAVPPLTSINIRKEDMGFQAAKCLISRIQRHNNPIQIRSIPPYLVRRESVRDRNKK